MIKNYVRRDEIANICLKQVYALIVSTNDIKWIGAALDSLRQSTVPVKIVVIDNASTDGSVGFIQQNYPEIELICLDSNVGFGKATNRGLTYAISQGADYCLLLNPDAAITPSMLEIMLPVFEKHPEYGILSPMHMDYEGLGVDYGFLGNLINERSLFSDAICGCLKPLYSIPRINAAIWLISRRALDTIGGFDPLFFVGGEDVDYCYRAHYHGLKIGLVTAARANHVHRSFGYGKKSNFTKEANLNYIMSILFLKNLEKNFYWSLINYLKSFILGLFSSLISFRLRTLAQKVFTTTKLLYNIRCIRKNYVLSKQTGRLWL